MFVIRERLYSRPVVCLRTQNAEKSVPRWQITVLKTNLQQKNHQLQIAYIAEPLSGQLLRFSFFALHRWSPRTTSYPTRIKVARFYVDKKNQLDVIFCILYFSYNSCSTCFGQPCAHHQELTTVWCYSLVLVCAVAEGRWSSPVGR